MINTQIRRSETVDEESNLLDSDSNINPSSPHRDQSDSENESAFLTRVEDLLNGTDNRKSSKHQILLQAQIVELQRKCNYLSLNNQKLVNKINEMMQEQMQNNENSCETSKIDESSYLGDISEMQNQFFQMESFIKSYREQLETYQNLIYQQKNKYDQQISLLQQEISLKDRKINSVQSELLKNKNDIFLLARKNQQLILEIQEIRQTKYKELNESFSRLDNSYDREFQLQLEKIIEKLVSELEYERNLKKKINEEIRRMSKEVQKQQKIIQKKNQTIYELQLKLIGNNKIKHIDNSWSMRGHSPRGKNIHQQKSFQHQYFTNEHKIQKNKNGINLSGRKISGYDNSNKSLLCELTNFVLMTAEVPIYISSKIIQIYEQTEKLGSPRILMNQKNIQVQNLNRKNIFQMKVVLLATKQPVQISRDPEQYFWTTFDLIQSLIISLSLQNLPSIKKAILDLSIASRNRNKIGSFGSLAASLNEQLHF